MTKPERAPFPWAPVIRFSLGRLRLSPAQFWALSLPELAALIGAHEGPEPATRNRLSELMARFPDKHHEDSEVAQIRAEDRSQKRSDADDR